MMAENVLPINRDQTAVLIDGGRAQRESMSEMERADGKHPNKLKKNEQTWSQF